MPSGSSRSGHFLPDENATLRQFEITHGLLFIERPTLAENRARLTALHEESGCRWWRATEGTLTDPRKTGAWVESPAVVMSRKGTRE